MKTVEILSFANVVEMRRNFRRVSIMSVEPLEDAHSCVWVVYNSS